MDMKILYNDLGQSVGYLINNVYYSNRNNKHFMVKYQDFGISDKIIKKLIENNCKTVIINYNRVKENKKYECPIEFFEKSNKTWYFTDDDLQKFVSIKDMVVIQK